MSIKVGGWLSSADTSSTQVPLHLLDGHGGQLNMEQPSSFTNMLYKDCIARVQARKVRQLDLESQTSKGKLQMRANQPLHVLFSNWATAEETEQRQLIAQLETLTSSPHYSIRVSCFTTPLILI